MVAAPLPPGLVHQAVILNDHHPMPANRVRPGGQLWSWAALAIPIGPSGNGLGDTCLSFAVVTWGSQPSYASCGKPERGVRAIWWSFWLQQQMKVLHI